MDARFTREGPLLEIESYPGWAQDMVADCVDSRLRVVDHELTRLMRDAELDPAQLRTFLTGFWPVIEQFPQYMAMNLCKVQYGRTPGHDMARHYLIRNIRVEQNHADHWVDWAEASGVSKLDLLYDDVPTAASALSHWCWHTCERDPLPAAMAATNYAIEGATGEWAMVICSGGTYEKSFEPESRRRAMKWLRLHAEYDDKHPWEALDIICTMMGSDPSPRDVASLRSSVRKSYEYMRLTLDSCLDAGSDVTTVRPPMPVERRERELA